MKAIRSFIHTIDVVMEWICHILLIGIVLVTVLQVFMRFVMNNPTSWSEEVALLLLIWFGLISIGIMVGRKGHIAITFFRDLLPGRWAIGLDLFADILVLVFSIFLITTSFELIDTVRMRMMPATGWSRSLLYYPILAGGSLMTLNAAIGVLDTALKLFRPEDEVAQNDEGQQ